MFYHRMTNNTIMSRRGCVERIEILPDGTIPTVETTSLGFEEVLNPYRETPAEIACVLTGGAFITEKNVFDRVIRNITDETCVLLGLKDVDDYMYIDYEPDHHIVDGGKATYREITEYVQEHYGLKVTSLDIAQVKDKCNLSK